MPDNDAKTLDDDKVFARDGFLNRVGEARSWIIYSQDKYARMSDAREEESKEDLGAIGRTTRFARRFFEMTDPDFKAFDHVARMCCSRLREELAIDVAQIEKKAEFCPALITLLTVEDVEVQACFTIRLSFED